MATQTVTVTDTWQQIASGVCVITVKKRGTGGNLYFNEVASDVDSRYWDKPAGKQFAQNEAIATWVKSSGTGWVLVVDGAI